MKLHSANEESDKGESITSIAVWFLRRGYILSTDRMDGYLLSATDREIPLSQPIFSVIFRTELSFIRVIILAFRI